MDRITKTAERHPTYNEMTSWTAEEIRAHIATCAGTRGGRCIPGHNALSNVIHEQKQQAVLTRIGKAGARTDGMTRKGRVPLRGNRSPGKRTLNGSGWHR